MTNLQLRLASAVVLIPLVCGALFAGGVVYSAFITLVFVLASYEWINLSLKSKHKIPFLALGIVYLPLSFYQFYILRTQFEDGLFLILEMLLITWAADSGAYFVGRKFGKHKMAPNISPNKSWEGLAGSMGFASISLVTITAIAAYFSGVIPSNIDDLSLGEYLQLLVLGLVLGFVGQSGDLLKSALKRSAGVKDSSNLIPGHGGILDRIDSLVLIVPFFVFLAKYVY